MKKERRDKLCYELQNNPLCKKYITPDILKKVIEIQDFYGLDSQIKIKHPKIVVLKKWKDIFVTEQGGWSVQQYNEKKYCRIIDADKKYCTHGKIEHIITPLLEHCYRKEHLKNMHKKEWGIVLCGGGGKGAYQVGVWKWLVDNGLANKITGISGASVGSLNSLLFVDWDYERARNAWCSIKKSDIVKYTNIKVLNKDVPVMPRGQRRLREFIENHVTSWDNIYNTEKIIYSSLTGTNTPLPPAEIIQYLLCKNVVKKKINTMTEYVCWSLKDKEEIKDIILASAAIPGLRKHSSIDGKRYIDGGLTDNVPVKPLVEDGFRNIIVVHLSRKYEKRFKQAVKGLDITNTKFYHVKPSKGLGGMLNVKLNKTEQRIAQGYDDAAAQLSELLG